MADSHSSLRDLELLMDHNIEVAAAPQHHRPSCAKSQPPHRPSCAKSQPPQHHRPKCFSHLAVPLEPHALHSPIANPSVMPALPAAASLSLAFGSMLSFNQLFSQPTLTLPFRNRALPNSRPQVAPLLPSQKKSISHMPVVPAITAAASAEAPSLVPSVVGSKKALKYATAFPDFQLLPHRGRDFSDPNNGGALRRASIVWFRNDLRIHDNEALWAANKESLCILPVYCFDPRDYGKSSSGFDKTGPYRAKFLLECVANLRESLRERGSDLIVRIGNPGELFLNLAKSIGADAIYVHQEVSHDEIQSENNVAAILKDEGVEIKYFWGSTLFHIEDLPFKLQQMPTTYSAFREKVQNLNVRPTIEAPNQLKGLPAHGGVKTGDIPTLQDLGLNPSSPQRQDGQIGRPLVGGEVEALRRLKSFASEHLKQSVDKVGQDAPGNSLYGANFSCKISPWLAMGCLSPRHMVEELKKNGRSAVSASSRVVTDDKELSWLVFELLWRDFFRFITKKYGSAKKSSDAIPATACADAFPA